MRADVAGVAMMAFCRTTTCASQDDNNARGEAQKQASFQAHGHPTHRISADMAGVAMMAFCPTTTFLNPLPAASLMICCAASGPK